MHPVANLADESCRFLMIVTRPGIEDFFRAQRDYLATVPPGRAPDPTGMAAVSGAEQRRVVGPPLTLQE